MLDFNQIIEPSNIRMIDIGLQSGLVPEAVYSALGS
jgi:hypothetical protein